MIENLPWKNDPPFQHGYTGCQCGHPSHIHKTRTINLSGHSDVPDYPFIRGDLGLRFDFVYFDPRHYETADNYCPGNGDFHRSIEINHTWEGYETALIMDILHKERGVVLDFGCNVGWYTVIAALKRSKVYGFETDVEMAEIAKTNLSINKLDGTIINCWLDHDSPKIPPHEILLVKADLEGGEPMLLTGICEGLFRQRTVKYALLEISPCFNDRYPLMCDVLIEKGYRLYDVPGKGCPFREQFERQPLHTTMQHRLVSNPTDYLKDVNQTNFLAVRV